MDERVITAIFAVVGVPAVLVAYIWGTEQVLRVVPEAMKPRVRPWLWMLPALALLGLFLVYPMVGTIIASFQNTAGTAWVGLENYQWFVGNNDALSALKNNLLWLVFLT
ncbi:MAG TPA: sugar ABC transporter permease, partial [Candidatus Binatia bacterium]|nr:sugar ABC transporter permease [Candidatus Binatia bacterium]